MTGPLTELVSRLRIREMTYTRQHFRTLFLPTASESSATDFESVRLCFEVGARNVCKLIAYPYDRNIAGRLNS